MTLSAADLRGAGRYRWTPCADTDSDTSLTFKWGEPRLQCVAIAFQGLLILVSLP